MATLQTPGEMEAAMLKNLKESIGFSLDEVMDAVEQSGLEKHGQIQKFLHKEIGMKYGFASVLAAIYLNGKKPVYGDPDALLMDQYEKTPHLRTIYDELIKRITSKFDLKIGVCKGYVSVIAKQQCLILNPRKEGLWVALNLPQEAIDSSVQDPKKLNVPPKFNAGIVLTSIEEVDEELMANVQLSILKFS